MSDWAAKVLEGVYVYRYDTGDLISKADALAAIARMGAGDDMVERLLAMDGDSMSIKTLDEAAAHIAALRATVAEANDHWARTSVALNDALAEAATLRATVAQLEVQISALTVGLDKARSQDREPDYCYDDEWEYTMPWDEWPDLVDGHDLTAPMAVNTLYKGPTKWVVRVPLDTDGDGEADDWEAKMFDSKDEARAALNDGGKDG